MGYRYAPHTTNALLELQEKNKSMVGFRTLPMVWCKLTISKPYLALIDNKAGVQRGAYAPLLPRLQWAINMKSFWRSEATKNPGRQGNMRV